MLENVSKHHSKRKILIWRHESVKEHIIKEELGDIDLDTVLETVYKKWCTISSVTEFTEFRKDIVQNNLGKDLRKKSEVLHFLIIVLDQG